MAAPDLKGHLDDPPDKPLVWCWSTTYPAINCSWRLETKTHLPTFFPSVYRLGMGGEVKECVQATTVANSCSIDNVQMFCINPYVLNVTVVNPLGTATTHYYFFQNEILKPDPPENLTVSQILGQRKKILLVWKPPSSWKFPEYSPLKYLIRYSRDGTNTSKMSYDERRRLLDRSPTNMFHDGYQDYTSTQASGKETKVQNEHSSPSRSH
ncbi:interleukin-27 subunit beta [Podarcis lilfordi]|uniref:Interleukin-27 subunit beta n=1 Tax=Podarcis lilfordi TaxID=74358 RepID=A0AA35LNI7_9SAUR|nr:interleukin-27 subunit beta [Podarcis lilfordi]